MRPGTTGYQGVLPLARDVAFSVLLYLNYRSVTRKEIKYQISSIFSEKVAIFVSHALPPPFSDDPNLINMGVLHIVSGHISVANTNCGVLYAARSFFYI